MRINEVERLVGITKKNIRFYEKEGLLSPSRERENDYRNYAESDVEQLKRIKLLRKLSVPLEEISRLGSGGLTLAEALEQHIGTLERRRDDLAKAARLCGVMIDEGAGMENLDVERYLAQMDKLEQEGARFMDVKNKDQKKKLRGPVIAAATVVLLMAYIVGILIWAFKQDMPPIFLALLLVLIPVVVVVGVAISLLQRIKEIKGGEEDAASKY